MDVIRGMVKSGDRLFTQAQRAVKKCGVYVLDDTRYKRTRFPDQPEEKRLWLDQRSMCILTSSDNTDTLFSENLYKKLAKDFTAVKPFYCLLLEADLRARPPVI